MRRELEEDCRPVMGRAARVAGAGRTGHSQTAPSGQRLPVKNASKNMAADHRIYRSLSKAS